MTALSKTPTIPASEVELLTQLQTESLPLLRARVRLLREVGWTLAQVGAPLGKNRSTTRMWQTGALTEHLPIAEARGPVPVPPLKPIGVRTIRLYPDVPESKRGKLYELATEARKVRGWMADTDPARTAAHQLEDKLVSYHELGVPRKRLADHMGVTHRAVAARLERVAAREDTDPVKPYEVTVAQASANVA